MSIRIHEIIYVSFIPPTLPFCCNNSFFIYIDTNDYNKAFYYAPTLGPLASEEEYYFQDQDGRMYTKDTPLAVNKSSVIKPLYVPAGYRPVTDFFGNDTEGNPITFDSVFIPGSYNSPWPYEEYGMTSGNRAYVWFDYASRETSGAFKTNSFDDRLTDGRSHQTKDMLVNEMLLTRRFLYRLLYENPQVTTSGSTVTINSDGTVYTFTSDAISVAKGLEKGDLTDGTYFNSAANNQSYGDVHVFSNLLTHLYNLNNPDKLSFVYYKIADKADYVFDPTRTNYPLLTDASVANKDSHSGSRLILSLKNATGFRLPMNHEFSYMARIITDERQIPFDSFVGNEDLVLSKERLGTKYAFKSVLDTTWSSKTSGGDWQGDSAGLAKYDKATGTYDKNVLRKGWEGMSRSAANQTISPLAAQKYSYNEFPTTEGAKIDYNTRNGAGLFGTFGFYFQIMDGFFVHYYSRSNATPTGRPTRGGCYSASSAVDSGLLRIPVTKNYTLDAGGSNTIPYCSLRFLRVLR